MTNSIADPGHGHSPAAWAAVIIMLLGFVLGTLFFCIEQPLGVWVSVALIPIGALVGWGMAKAGWGVKGPKYQPKGH
ncbi:MAG: HGxxPAAW family protein [Microbacterium sp.]